jgi:hypothetical protein
MGGFAALVELLTVYRLDDPDKYQWLEDEATDGVSHLDDKGGYCEVEATS